MNKKEKTLSVNDHKQILSNVMQYTHILGLIASKEIRCQIIKELVIEECRIKSLHC